jgi:hypothetical protein
MVSIQGSHAPYDPVSLPGPDRYQGVGGDGFGGTAEIGGFLTRRVSLGVEVSIPNRFTAVQDTGGFFGRRIESRHRDLAFSALFGWHVNRGGAAQIVVVSGPAVVREDTLQRSAYGDYSGTIFTSFGEESELGRWTVGMAAGIDIPLRVTQRVDLVPHLRAYWVQRASVTVTSRNEYNSFALGLGEFVWRPGVGVRVHF